MSIGIEINKPSEQFTLGIHLQSLDAFKVDEETGEVDRSVEPIQMYELIIGFLIFSIKIYW